MVVLLLLILMFIILCYNNDNVDKNTKQLIMLILGIIMRMLIIIMMLLLLLQCCFINNKKKSNISDEFSLKANLSIARAMLPFVCWVKKHLPKGQYEDAIWNTTVKSFANRCQILETVGHDTVANLLASNTCFGQTANSKQVNNGPEFEPKAGLELKLISCFFSYSCC